MKTNDPLDSLLASWQPKPSVPADFRQAVWTRIAAAQAEAPDSVAAGNFARRRAWMAAAAAVVLGFGLGILTPPQSTSPDSAREAYFARINPLTTSNR